MKHPPSSLAYRAGVTSAITPPHAYGFLHGLSTAFSTGSAHKLEHGALIQNIAALHIGISMGSSLSVSTQIAALRRLLLGGGEGDLGLQFEKVTKVRGVPYGRECMIDSACYRGRYRLSLMWRVQT